MFSLIFSFRYKYFFSIIIFVNSFISLNSLIISGKLLISSIKFLVEHSSSKVIISYFFLEILFFFDSFSSLLFISNKFCSFSFNNSNFFSDSLLFF